MPSTATETGTNTDGYTVTIPTGFVPLPRAEPSNESLDECSAQLADALLVDNDRNCRVATGALTRVANIAEELGVERSAIGFFISPNTGLPVMLMLTMTGFRTDPSDIDLAIAGIIESVRSQAFTSPREIQIPAGPAVLTVEEKPSWLSDGSTETPLLQRSLTLWTPSPTTDSVGVVSIATNSWPDWDLVCDMSLDIFNTLDWDTQDA